MSTVSFIYRFIFSDGRKLEHKIDLNAETGLIVEQPSQPESWTELEFNKCSHCPLNAKDSPQCPVAKNLSAVAQSFKTEISHSKVTVEVESAERIYKKELSVQEGLFGLFGLIMATSACPYLAFLRPMARFHLPFSNLEETMVRSASFYLFKQYFVLQNGGKPDFELKDFGKLYENLNSVNLGIIERIRSIADADANANSIVILDSFSSLLPTETSNKFKELEHLFN